MKENNNKVKNKSGTYQFHFMNTKVVECGKKISTCQRGQFIRVNSLSCFIFKFYRRSLHRSRDHFVCVNPYYV